MLAGEESADQPNALHSLYQKFSMRQQYWLDVATPHTVLRWLFLAVLAAVYLVRVFFLQGWYIVTYAIGIYILNQFIAFLTPKLDPGLRDYEEDGYSLPTKSSEEFRPFMRQLPELKFWYSTARAIVIGLICTLFDFFNIPVFWPILVIYFFILFTFTMKKQIQHMIRHKYIPFTHGKTHYKGKSDTGKVVSS